MQAPLQCSGSGEVELRVFSPFTSLAEYFLCNFGISAYLQSHLRPWATHYCAVQPDGIAAVSTADLAAKGDLRFKLVCILPCAYHQVNLLGVPR